MNVENLFVKGGDRASVVEIVTRCLANPAEQPAWGLLSSYSPLLVNDPKRKIAISPETDGWTAIIESKEVVDFGMAKLLADELGGTAVVVQVSDAIGAMGKLIYRDGGLVTCVFDEDATDPLNDGRAVLRQEGIPFDLLMFREVVRLVADGWLVKQRP
jgi:hypothetical protein